MIFKESSSGEALFDLNSVQREQKFFPKQNSRFIAFLQTGFRSAPYNGYNTYKKECVILKRIISLLLALTALFSVLTACGDSPRTDSDEDHHIIYFKDKNKSDAAVATFFNSDSEESEDIPMSIVGRDKDSHTFSCEGNCAKYNMAYVTCGGKKTKIFAFNKCVSGWYSSELGFLPYTEGEQTNYYPEFDHIDFPFNGYTKTVHVWTPKDYDSDSDGKYAVIYALDSQWMVNLAKKGQTPIDCINLTVQASSMTAETGYKAIIVAVDCFGDMGKYNRDNEMVPDIGAETTEYQKYDRLGGAFSDFLSETLVPYIRENYNVYDDARHTAIAGMSLSGLEAFYIAMEHPDLFGTVGALSPSFWMYDDEGWSNYLKAKNFGGEMPFVYLYTGGVGGDTDPQVTQMYNRLRDMGYPADKIAFHYYEWGMHGDDFWRGVLAEFLEAFVYGRVAALAE